MSLTLLSGSFFSFVFMMLLASCTTPVFEEAADDVILSLDLTKTTGSETPINNLYVFVAEGDEIVAIENTTATSLIIRLPETGVYDVYAVANHTDGISSISVGDNTASISAALNNKHFLEHESNIANHTLVGCAKNVSVLPGHNYLGTVSAPFELHRLVAKIKLNSLTNNSALTITGIHMVNVKNQMQLNNNLEASVSTDNVNGSLTARTGGYIYDYTTYTQGNAGNNAGGALYPRVYFSDSFGASTKTFAQASSNMKDLTSVTTVDYLTAAYDADSDISFFVFPNDNNPLYPTMMVIEAVNSSSDIVYFSVKVNDPNQGSFSGSDGSTFVKANYQYLLDVTISADAEGSSNFWGNDDDAYLNVNLTMASWTVVNVNTTIN